MKKRKRQTVVVETDRRLSFLKHNFGTVELSLKLYQLDLLKIHKALIIINNKYLASRIQWYIDRYDEISEEKTRKRKKLPKIIMEKYEEKNSHA